MPAPATYRYLPPQLADRLRSAGITVRRPVEGAIQGLHRSPHHGSSVEFAEYREYTKGDPPNLIDWAVFARSDRYVIRRFLEETNLRACIALDTSESLAFKEDGIHSKIEYASYLAACLMYILVNQGDSVGLFTFDRELRSEYPPAGTFEGLRPMLLGLEEIEPSGLSNIEASLHAIAERVQSKSLIIIISDLLQPPDQILRGLQHLHHDGHDITIFHVLDPAEIDLPFGGFEEFKELETGNRMVVDIEEIRSAYRDEVQNFLDEVRTGCAECMADYLLIDTQFPIEDSLYKRVSRQ